MHVSEVFILFFRGFVPRRARNRRALAMLLPVAALLLSSCGTTGGIAEPEIIETEIRSEKLPEELDGLRIVLVSDLHVDSRRSPEYLPRIVERMNALSPDLVALAGDLVDGTAAELVPQLEALRELKTRHGVFGVPGNHEYGFEYRDYMALLPFLGVTMLENSHRMIHPGFAVAGITDPAAKNRRLPGPDLSAALKGIPKHAFVLLLAHRPQYCTAASKRGVDLQLSGHTHGGLVRGLEPLIVHGSDGFVAGTYQVGNTILYVSRGAVTWDLGRPASQMRIGVPAEIALLILRRP